MKKYILGAVFSFALLASPFATHAAGLTSAQVQSILSLLSSFGAEQSVINKVSVALTGDASTGAQGAWCHTFKKNFGIGNQNEDVIALDVVFSKELPRYQYRGGDHIYFDEQFASAVTGFQEKYSSEILTPNGLKYGTGYVGASTRAKLNRLYGCDVASAMTTAPIVLTTTDICSPLLKDASTLIFTDDNKNTWTVDYRSASFSEYSFTTGKAQGTDGLLKTTMQDWLKSLYIVGGPKSEICGAPGTITVTGTLVGSTVFASRIKIAGQ